jgi:CO dehydrogenase maturation factor
MRIAVAGKGGAGKTTISATLARMMARAGRRVLAIDGDPNPNLGVALGIDRDVLERAPRVPRDCVVDVYDQDGKQHMQLKTPLRELVAAYAITAPDGVELMQVEGVDHAGQG